MKQQQRQQQPKQEPSERDREMDRLTDRYIRDIFAWHEPARFFFAVEQDSQPFVEVPFSGFGDLTMWANNMRMRGFRMRVPLFASHIRPQFFLLHSDGDVYEKNFILDMRPVMELRERLGVPFLTCVPGFTRGLMPQPDPTTCPVRRFTAFILGPFAQALVRYLKVRRDLLDEFLLAYVYFHCMAIECNTATVSRIKTWKDHRGDKPPLVPHEDALLWRLSRRHHHQVPTMTFGQA